MSPLFSKCTVVLLAGAAFGVVQPLRAQNLKSFAGRWELQRDTTAADSATATPVAGQRARAGRAGAGAGAGRGGAGRLGAAAAQLAQVMTVMVRGDTVFSTDSITTAQQVVVRVDTFVVNGTALPHESTPLLAGLAQRAGAGARAGAGNGRVAGAARAAAQPVMGTRRAEKAPTGSGFVVVDSSSRALANRTVDLKSEQKWTLSADGKTLTVESTVAAAAASVPTKRVYQLTKGTGKGG